MSKRTDMCVCGHIRENHNNRIIKPFYYQMRYNCCLEKSNCPCQRFKLHKIEQR